MMTFKERLKKPSNAVQAMIDGLREIDEEGSLEIDMNFYVRLLMDEGRCLACAATAAALKATGTPADRLREVMLARYPGGWDLLAAAMGVREDDIREFEMAMDMFRRGSLSPMLRYFDIPGDSPAYDGSHRWHLGTHNWRSQLKRVEEYRDELIELGL